MASKIFIQIIKKACNNRCTAVCNKHTGARPGVGVADTGDMPGGTAIQLRLDGRLSDYLQTQVLFSLAMITARMGVFTGGVLPVNSQPVSTTGSS